MRSSVILALALILPGITLPGLAQPSALSNPLNPSGQTKSQDPMDLFMKLQQLSNTGANDFDSSTELDSAIRNFRKRQQAPVPEAATPVQPQQPQP